MSVDHLAEQQLTRINVMQPWLGEEEAQAIVEVVASGWVAEGEYAVFTVSLTSPMQRARRLTLSSTVEGSTLVKQSRSSESPAGSG